MEFAIGLEDGFSKAQVGLVEVVHPRIFRATSKHSNRLVVFARGRAYGQ